MKSKTKAFSIGQAVTIAIAILLPAPCAGTVDLNGSRPRTSGPTNYFNRYRSIILRSLLLFAILCQIAYLPAWSQTRLVQYPIKDCRGNVAGACREGECACREWQIALLTSGGREWGLITGKSLESVQRKLKSGQDFDIAWARFTGKSVSEDRFNHQHPGKPTCVIECPRGQSPSSSGSPAGQRRRDEIDDFATQIQDKIVKEMGRIIKALANAERKGANPYKGVGLVLTDYANTLRDVMEKQKELRTRLESAYGVLAGTLSELDRLQKSLEAADNRAQRAYEQMPDNARRVIETGELPGIDGGWASQRIRDFDNSTAVQTIDLSGSRIRVTLQGVDAQSGKTTYALSASDIIPESILVRSTSAADRWIVQVNTNGRRITKQSDWINGPVTDNISRLTLFFSTEESARAAADTLKSLH